jgi:hypothetical protein
MHMAIPGRQREAKPKVSKADISRTEIKHLQGAGGALGQLLLVRHECALGRRQRRRQVEGDDRQDEAAHIRDRQVRLQACGGAVRRASRTCGHSATGRSGSSLT